MVKPDVLRFPLSRGPWVLESPSHPSHHVEALGEQAGVWGSLAHGFEGWAYPFKLFDGESIYLLATPAARGDHVNRLIFPFLRSD